MLHQAAIPSVQRSVADPLSTNRANITATLNLLESCHKTKVRRLVFAAFASVSASKTGQMPRVRGAALSAHE